MNATDLMGTLAGIWLGLAFLTLAMIATAIAIELWRRRHGARRVERALLYEVQGLHMQAGAMAVEIARRYRAGEAFDADFFSLWRLSAPLVYPAVGAELGRLSREAIDRVGYFHAQLADARGRLAEARAGGGFAPSPYRMLTSLVRAYYHVQPWHPSLQPGRNPVMAYVPDLADACSLLAEFERADVEPLPVAYGWADCAAFPDA